MAAGRSSKSPCGSAGIPAPVGSRHNVISPRPFWRPISLLQILLPRMRSLGTPPAGKVRSRACGQHTSKPSNARARGTLCPAASVSLELERVCPKVLINPSSNQQPCCGRDCWKRSRKTWNLQGFSPERTQCFYFGRERGYTQKEARCRLASWLADDHSKACQEQGECVRATWRGGIYSA